MNWVRLFSITGILLGMFIIGVVFASDSNISRDGPSTSKQTTALAKLPDTSLPQAKGSEPAVFSYNNLVSKKPKFIEYKNATFGITLKYPGDWSTASGKVGNSDIVFFFSPIENKSDSFRENVNIVRESLNNRTMDQLSNESLQEVKQMENSSISYENDTMISGIPAKEVIYTATLGPHLKFQMYYLIRGDQVYAITYTAMPDTYTKYLDNVTGMIDSLQFI
jgi:hypothetical protein